MARLNQILASEKGAKAEAQQNLNRAAQLASMPTSGITRTYTPKDDDGDHLPPESTRVQVRADEVLRQAADALTRLYDVVATKDLTNCAAKADVTVDGETILSDVPVTTLLFLEKQLTELRAVLARLPVLELSETWAFDPARACHATEPRQTTRTQKLPRNHVLAEATEHHPAQVQVYTEDIVVGTWTTVKLSGAMESARVAELVERAGRLLEAVKSAREDANITEARDMRIGKRVFDFLLA